MKFTLFCIIVFSVNLHTNGQHMFSKQFPFFSQLSSNEIFDIHQDKEGFLWIATTNGLARYDRYKLVNFRSDYRNQNLLANNGIINIDDSNLYVWIANWGGLNLYDKLTCRIIPFPDARLYNKPINYVAVDKKNNAWVATDRKIYKCDSIANIVKEYNLVTPEGENQNDINSIYVDLDNRIWVMSTGGIFRYHPIADAFVHYLPYALGSTAYTMYQEKSGVYWIGTWGMGLWQFFPDQEGMDCYKQYDVINPRTGKPEEIVFSIEQDDTFNYLWVLSYAGLYALKNIGGKTFENVDLDNLIDTQMMYTRFCKDREGNLWLGSYDMAYTIFFDNSNIDNYLLPQFKKQMGWDVNVLNLCLDNDHIVWFEQDRFGLCVYDLSRNLFAGSSIGEVNIITKSFHKPGVWVNSKYHPRLMRLTQKNLKIQIEESVNLGGITNLIEDKEGNLWVSTWTNLNVKRPDSESLIVSDESIPRMNFLTRDAKGEIWGISDDRHIYRFSCTADQIVYESKGYISEILGKELIDHVCIDKEGCLWINTSLGRILKSDHTKQAFESVSIESTINDCIVIGLLPDNDNVWIVANKKVLQYNIDSHVFQSYATEDENIMVDVFRNKAISSDRQGGLYVGGHRGFIHIKSDLPPKTDNVYPHLHITDVKVEDKSIFFGDTVSENTIRKIFLEPGARNFEIFFSPLLYSLNVRYRIAYQLEGVDQDWVYLDNSRSSAFYNHLTKGTYKFRLKLEDKQGKWTEGKVLLTIIKAPAFYETGFAYFVYTILVGLCFYVVVRFYLRRVKWKNEIKFQEELTRIKLNYFTNVSHELLTPLTVISCISDYLNQEVPIVRKQSVMLKANTDKLKRLIQQVLDFRKMDAEKLKLNVSYGDLYKLVQTICAVNFLPLAQKKNIMLEVHLDAKELQGYADFDKLDKIMHNLLSNALKYTPENKHILVEAEEKVEKGCRVLTIRVKDEGIGIAAKDIEHIFTRFHSVRKDKGFESNGIGLSLTKDLINLHNGTIKVDSVLGKGACFVVELPIDKESYSADELIDEIIDLHTSPDNVGYYIPSGEMDKPAVLIIDDNTELLSIMKDVFRERYMVLTAMDGLQAWDKLKNNEVDVIICDIMLPDINGWELCARIKKDLRFNHIPVIILTAKNGIEDRVASYEAGADGYIAKPFELKILFARVDNLIRSSKMLQIAFRREENISLESLAYPSVDKKFLESIIHSVEQHLEESEFDLEQLSIEMNMSKSTLYRKIKSMTGMTPLEFVRNIKMKRACMMLLSRTRNISEIAYSLGFSSPKYFTKCFKDEYDITPSEYLQKHNNKDV